MTCFFSVYRKIPEVANGEDKSGTTVCSVLISPKYVIFSNCGDSRGVLSGNGEPVLVTLDHKPSNPPELERIQNAGKFFQKRINIHSDHQFTLGTTHLKSSLGFSPVKTP